MADYFVGEIRLFSTATPPSGWHICDGSPMQISQYGALFSLLGTMYGGDGRTTFGLPDLRGRVPLGCGTSPISGTAYTQGQQGGEVTVTLTQLNLPTHSHTLGGDSHAGTIADPQDTLFATAAKDSSGGTHPLYAAAGAIVPLIPAAVSNDGGGKDGKAMPHNNEQPLIVLNFCIALGGSFPPHP